MAGVHGLQQVKSLGATYLANDDTFRPHSQAVSHQASHRDLALSLEIGRPGLQPYHVRLLKLQLGRVFAGDDTFVRINVVRQAVEQRCLAGTCAAGDDDIAAHPADDLEDLRTFGRDRAVAGQVVQRELVPLELANGKDRAVDRKWWHDHVDPRAIGKARIADRRRLINPTADLTNNSLAYIKKLSVVAEADIRFGYLAANFNKNPVATVHHYVGDFITGKERLKRAVPQNVVADAFEQLLLLAGRHDHLFDV